MGRPKALLTLAGETFLARVLRAIRDGGVSRTAIVTGTHHDAIAEHLAADPLARSALVIRNPDRAGDQLSSLRAALTALGDDPAIDGVLVALVDHPLIDADTVRALVHAHDASHAPIVRPVCDGRHGHPVIFGRDAFEMLRHGNLPDGAKGVLRAFSAREVLVPTTNAGVLVDVDTPDDYARLAADDARG
jgi:molybdenum cofactor cytidylyltransferase